MDSDIRQFARDVIVLEAAAVARMAEAIDDHFDRAVELLLECPASVLVSGIGKAGNVARKISATLASTGTPSHFLSPTDAVHGDLGSIRRGDVLLLLSSSGESDEILRLLDIVKKLNHPVVAITAARTSTLARFADVVIAMGKVEEACPLRLAPTASTTAMLALGDALAMAVMQRRQFTADDFVVFHPAGQIGRRLVKVAEAMTFRLGDNLAVADESLTVAQMLHAVSSIKRRSGAVVLTDGDGQMTGIFTDGDLRRLLTDNDGSNLRRPVREVMHKNPKRVRADQLASEAMAIMRQHRIDELPVVDEFGKPVGLIDVQDLVVLKLFEIEPEP